MGVEGFDPDDMLATFTVIGDPKPQGSKSAFTAKGSGRAMTKESGGVGFAAWRNLVSEAAMRVRDGEPSRFPLDGPMRLHAGFRFAMPKSAPKADRERGWRWKSTAPDTSKLVRLIEDSMQAAGLIKDDARFSSIFASKVEWVDQWSGVTIWIERLH